MKTDDNRHSSFLVITAADRVDRGTLEAALDVPVSYRPALMPLGGNRFAVSRPAMKRMLIARDWNCLRRWLIKKKELIREVRLDSADAVLADYRNRCFSTLQRNSESRKFWAPGEFCALEDVQGHNPATKMDESHRLIRLGHLDTGYTKHPAFGFGEEADTSFLAVDEGVNFLDPGELPLEPLSHTGSPAHGTETLSLISRAMDEYGFRGLATGWTIIPYRVTDSAAVDTSDDRAALERAVRHAAFDAVCDIICIPLSDPCPPPASLAEQIDAAYDAGVMIVAAAGEMAGEVAYPGRYQRVITVSGATPSDSPWRSAARGRAVDICAPATEVWTATAGLIGGSVCYDYCSVDGTSYAAALVAGAALLWLAHQSSWPYRDWRLVEAFRTCLRESAKRPAGWDDRRWGAGILDISRLLGRRLPDPAALNAVTAAVAQKW